MISEEYRKFVLELGTADGQFIPATVSMLGLCGEAAEVLVAHFDFANTGESRQNLLLELGDVVWYVTALAIAFGTPSSRLRTNAVATYFGAEACCHSLVTLAGSLADLWKKDIWHGRQMSSEAADLKLGAILSCVEGAAVALGSSLDEVIEMNIQKLRKRWPAGFRQGAAT